VSNLWVVNASPVIVLGKAGYLQLLEQLPTELLLPDVVAAEIEAQSWEPWVSCCMQKSVRS
jgi:hypothetical protein